MKVLPPEMVELRKIVGAWAFKRLQAGGPLQIWRCSSPHNWFIAKEQAKRGDSTLLWHSCTTHGEHPEIVCKKPDLRLFDEVGESAARINYPGMFKGSDHGLAELSLYRLKKQYLVRPTLRQLFVKFEKNKPLTKNEWQRLRRAGLVHFDSKRCWSITLHGECNRGKS